MRPYTPTLGVSPVAAPVSSAVMTTTDHAPRSKTRWVRLLPVALVAVTSPVWVALLVRAFVVESFRIPSPAMFPTLQIGDTVFCLKSSSAAAPTRGGVRVFIYPSDPSKDFVSRVVAVGGDRVLVLLDGTIVRNGVALRRCALGPWPDAAEGTSPSDAFMEADGALRYVVLQGRGAEREPTHAEHCVAEACTVPAGHALTLGDNRDNSYDGRYWGFVPVANFKASPWRIFASTRSQARVWADPQGAPVLPPSLEAAWARCLAQLR